MKEFATLINSLDQTNKTSVKLSALQKFFHTAVEEDKLWAIALFTHRRPKRAINSTQLKEWVAEWANIPYWLFEESYHAVGDLAETISLLYPENPTPSKKKKSLSNYIQILKELTYFSDKEKKEKLSDVYVELNNTERFIFTKLITGGWRVGVSQNLITKALSETYKVDKNIMTHRIMGNWKPEKTTFKALIIEESKGDNDSRPYPFYLAHPIENQEVTTLLNTEDWQAEWKWDGIRGQIIKRNEEVFIWSRGEELITDKFPELEEMAKIWPNGTVLDGEIIPHAEGAPLSFALLQKRIGRKNLSKKLLEEVPIKFIAYDLLEHHHMDTRNIPLKERVTLLEDISSAYAHPNLIISETIAFTNWQELTDLRKQSRARKAEGLMLKRLESNYQVGRKRGDWWKWKIAPLTIDAVMINALKGHGRRADLFSDYTFGVWNGKELVPFAKAYSGLTDKEMVKITDFVKKNTKERFGPVRSVKPELVFEIAFEGIQQSNRHKSGVAVRFPRIKRWRLDKPANEANTLSDLKELLEKYG